MEHDQPTRVLKSQTNQDKIFTLAAFLRSVFWGDPSTRWSNTEHSFAEQGYSGLSQASWILHLRLRGHLFTFGNPRHMLKQVPWLLDCEWRIFLNGHRFVESPFYICKAHSPLFRHLQSYKEWVPVFSRLNTLPVVNSCLRAQSSRSAGWIIVVLQN